MRRAAGLALALLFAGAPVEAAPEISPIPRPRPVAAALPAPAAAGATVVPRARPEAAAPVEPVVPIAAGVHPRPRPVQGRERIVPPVTQVVMVTVPGLASSLVPRPRPENLKRRSIAVAMVPVRPEPLPETSRSGSVCGIRTIKGTSVPAIPGRVAGCGVDKPVRVTSVQGLALSQPATIDCGTAKALDAWAAKAVQPQFGKLGGGVVGLEVAASYACRPRNNQRGKRISEHGRGRAIDISGFILKNGVTVTVLKGWRDAGQGKILKALHRAACGPFGTVLGPGSDGFHENHLHLDTARYRGGNYCR